MICTDKRLRALVNSNRIPHALIIDGGTKEERFATAKELSLTFFCSGEAKPCGECLACKRIQGNSFPDVSIIEKEEDKKTLTGNIISEMISDCYMLPHESNHKVYIIKEAELIDSRMQNKLLKTLEEPPKNVTFILLCPYHSVFLPTILSRAAVFTLSDEETESKNEFPDEIIKQAQGIADALSQKNESQLIFQASNFDPSSDKKYATLAPTIDCLQLIVRDALMVDMGIPLILSDTERQAHNLSKSLTHEQLLNVQEALKALHYATDIYSNKNLTVTRLSSLLMTAITTPYTGGNK